MLKKFDKDGDGRLNEDERKAWLESLPEPLRKRILEQHKRRQEIVREFDKDGDGRLSEEERQAAREAMRQRMEKRRGEGRERPGKGPGGRPGPGRRPQAL